VYILVGVLHPELLVTSYVKTVAASVGELVAERADMIVAPLTINPERAQAGAPPLFYNALHLLIHHATVDAVWAYFVSFTVQTLIW
jgi:hypothetical protein